MTPEPVPEAVGEQTSTNGHHVARVTVSHAHGCTECAAELDALLAELAPAGDYY